MDGLWATKSEGVGLILTVQLVSKISNLCDPDPDPPTLQTDRQTDGQHAISIPRYALVHRAVKRIHTGKIFNFAKLGLQQLGLK